MQTLHPGKTDGVNSKSGFVLLRALITMFIVLFCLAGILFSLSVISRRSSVFREEVYREIDQRNEDSKFRFMSGKVPVLYRGKGVF